MHQSLWSEWPRQGISLKGSHRALGNSGLWWVSCRGDRWTRSVQSEVSGGSHVSCVSPSGASRCLVLSVLHEASAGRLTLQTPECWRRRGCPVGLCREVRAELTRGHLSPPSHPFLPIRRSPALQATDVSSASCKGFSPLVVGQPTCRL